MALVAGVDFGTLSVRVSIVDSERGRLGHAIAEYPLVRKPDDPDHGTQAHSEHMRALVEATRAAVATAGVQGEDIAAMALDTTGSSVVVVDEKLVPLGDYYLWCDHRSWREAGEITAKARASKLPHIDWCGGVYSSEWGWSKLLHWLRHNPQQRDRMATALEHCDMVAAVLCGIDNLEELPRSICAMGHKWLWNASLGGFPPEDFFLAVDPLLAGSRAKLSRGRYLTSDHLAGHLSAAWAAHLGLREGIPIPIGAFDAHWDAVGANIRVGDVVNVVGTSTCMMAISEQATLIPGLCGVVPGSIDPALTGIEAGLSATGDLFDAIARRAGTTVTELSKGLESYRAGQTGLLRLTWDNGDRTVLVNPELSGVTLGWRLGTTPQDELFAAIEGTAMHKKIILDRMASKGTAIERVINGGGIPQKNDTLNRIYANVFGKPVLVPEAELTSLGAAIFAFLACGAFRTIREAQEALCPRFRVVEPVESEVSVYRDLFGLFEELYFQFGASGQLERLRRLARRS